MYLTREEFELEQQQLVGNNAGPEDSLARKCYTVSLDGFNERGHSVVSGSSRTRIPELVASACHHGNELAWLAADVETQLRTHGSVVPPVDTRFVEKPSPWRTLPVGMSGLPPELTFS